MLCLGQRPEYIDGDAFHRFNCSVQLQGWFLLLSWALHRSTGSLYVLHLQPFYWTQSAGSSTLALFPLLSRPPPRVGGGAQVLFPNSGWYLSLDMYFLHGDIYFTRTSTRYATTSTLTHYYLATQQLFPAPPSPSPCEGPLGCTSAPLRTPGSLLDKIGITGLKAVASKSGGSSLRLLRRRGSAFLL